MEYAPSVAHTIGLEVTPVASDQLATFALKIASPVCDRLGRSSDTSGHIHRTMPTSIR